MTYITCDLHHKVANVRFALLTRRDLSAINLSVTEKGFRPIGNIEHLFEKQLHREVYPMSTFIDYRGRVWTCSRHHDQIEEMLKAGKEAEANALVAILNPKKSRGICKECKRLWQETPPMNR